MNSSTPLALRLEPRSLNALRALGMELERRGKYRGTSPDRPPRINPTQSIGNRVLYGVPGSEIYGVVADAVDRIGLARVTGRDDQSIAAEIVMSVDGAWAAAREAAEPGWREAFVQRCARFLLDKYGADRVVSITDHRDERAPHIHAVILPIAEIRRGNRYGNSDPVQKISYTKVFCPGGRAEYAARWEKAESTADSTYTGRLQTDAAAALADLGIVRGARGSAAHRKHMTRDDFYGVIAAAQNALAEDLPPAPPAPEALLEKVDEQATKSFNRVLDSPAEIAKAGFRGGWAQGYAAAMAAARRSPAISRAAERDVERERRREADAAAERAREREREERRKRSMAEDELKILRDRLRTIPAAALNEWLGDAYPLEIESGGRRRRVQNAYDRLVYHGIPEDGRCRRLSFAEATEWLAERFPADVDGIAQSAAENAATEARTSAAETATAWLRKRILRDVRLVYDALGVSELRILAIKPKEKGEGGKKKSAGIRLTPEGASEGTPMTVADFERNLPLLMAKNAEGFGIYAQARMRGEVDGVRDVLLIDDIERPASDSLEARGPEDVRNFIEASDPNLYLRTSQFKTQALYSLPLEPGDRDHDLRNAVLRRLNAAYGDPAIAKSGSIIHTFRLPGFLNHKRSADAFPVQIIRKPHAGASTWAQEQIREEAKRRLATTKKPASPDAPSGEAWWTKERKKKAAATTRMLEEIAAGPGPR